MARRNDDDGGGRCRPVRPMVSVVMPVRNGAALIGEQLAALADQDYAGDWELIVVDDGSSDDSVAVASSWSDRIQMHVLVGGSGDGAGAGRNYGRRQATGEFLVFCDHDDRVNADWLSALVSKAQEVDVVAGVVDCGPLNDPVVRSWKDDRPRDSLVVAHGWLPSMIGANCGMWAEVFDAMGGFDERILGHEDVDLAWRAQLAGFTIGLATDAVVDYRYRVLIRQLARQSYHRYRSVAVLTKLHREHLASGGSVVQTTNSIGQHVRFLVSAAPRAVIDRRTRGRWVNTVAQIAGRVVGEFETRRRTYEPWSEASRVVSW